jgi:hypothetical protein
MRRAGRDRPPGDLIAEYLDQLRAGLRVAPQEAELILAEAEDHLRETAAAGVAIGMTELEAQQAAISSFGSAGSVVRAHLARFSRAAVAGGDIGMAVWKLVSILLLAAGVSGMAAHILAGFRASAYSWHFIQFSPATPPPHVTLPVQHVVFNVVTGVWSDSINGGAFTVRWPESVDVGWQACSVAAIMGVIMLTGYRLTRHRRAGSSPRPPLAWFFPAVATGFFGAVTLTLFGLNMSGVNGAFDPGLVIAACLALAVSYAVRTARMLHRKG